MEQQGNYTTSPGIANGLIQAVPENRTPSQKINGRALIAHNKKVRKTNLKIMRQPHSFKAIPESLYMGLMILGRGKYCQRQLKTDPLYYKNGNLKLTHLVNHCLFSPA